MVYICHVCIALTNTLLRYHWRSISFYDSETESCESSVLKCPACPKNEGKLFVSLDACFGLPRKKTSGMSYRTPLSANMYFHNQQDVDTFLATYPRSSSGDFRSGKDCSDFKAGSEISSKTRYDALDETAVCGLACKHGFPMDFLNLKGGERLGYAVHLLNSLTSKIDNKITIHFMYDICCLLEAHLKKQNNLELLSKIKLACPQFHVYGHGATCQLLYSPRRLEGWGLVDGEVLERLWSYLRLFRKMTKEMAASHREDILSDALYFYSKKQKSRIVLMLHTQRQRCVTLGQSSLVELQDLRKNSTVYITDGMLAKWKQEESDYLRKSTPDEVDLGPHKWVVEYFSLLRQYYSARNQLSEGVSDSQHAHLMFVMKSFNNRLLKFETENKIQKRWTPTDSCYLSSLRTQEMIKAKQTRDMMLVSGRRRWFLLSLKRKYADGQAQAKRLSKSITKESANLRKLLKKYNSSVDILQQHGYSQFAQLTWDVASDVSSQIYTVDVPSEDIIPLSVKRTAIDAFLLMERCKEEKEIVEQEMGNCINDFYRNCSKIEKYLEDLKNKESFPTSCIMKGLYSLQKKELDWQLYHLFVAHNLYKDSILVREEVHQYIVERFSKTELVYEYDEEELEDDEEEEHRANEDSYED